MVPSTAMEETRARTVSKSNTLQTFLLPLRNCVEMLMMTATKAVTQKRMVKVAVSRKITRKGSTKTQMAVGRMARERRWIKHVKVQRTSKRIANGHRRNDIAFGVPSAVCEDSGWSLVSVAVMHCANIMPSRQTDPTSASLTIMNGVRFNVLDDIPSTSNLISNATIEALHAVTTKKAAQIKECHHHWFCSLSVFPTSQI